MLIAFNTVVYLASFLLNYFINEAIKFISIYITFPFKIIVSVAQLIALRGYVWTVR